tara:strand:- start:83 stop:292 length:210 start_codon:yes stop_codon:yes gene_type:complete
MKMGSMRMTWKCVKCGSIVVSHSDIRHDMNFCKCGEAGVDLEEFYTRTFGKIDVISLEEKTKDGWDKVK